MPLIGRLFFHKALIRANLRDPHFEVELVALAHGKVLLDKVVEEDRLEAEVFPEGRFRVGRVLLKPIDV